MPVYISTELFKKVEQNVKASQGEFKTVEEYVEFVLREVIKEDIPEQVYTPEEEQEIKKRLRSLGYL
jgi:hypothetical protein